MLAGTNNLAANSPEDIARGIGEIVRTCRHRAPRATILLTGILPREGLPDGLARIDAVNRRIRKLAGKQVRFIDVRDKLADENGKVVEGVTVDGLHLSVKGYQVWADALQPHLFELLGPRSTTDLASPPTGDPGIREAITTLATSKSSRS